MNKFVVSFFAVLALAGCSAAPSQPDAKPELRDAPLADARIGGPFMLTDQNGKKRSDKEFTGQFRIIYFGYTNCPDICTPDVQHLMAGLTRFEKAQPALAGKVQPIFITVDPARDTPAVLKQFVEAFHPRLIGLTGNEAEIAALAKAYATTYQKVEGSTPGSYLMSHLQLPYLMGPDGRPLALLPADKPDTEVNEGTPEMVAAELAKWVR